MATTISYKDNILASFTNGSKVLKTAGKYLEDDITVQTSNNIMTQHVIHLEFIDSTTTDINVYYDDNFLNTIITNFNPSTYGGKNIKKASLDGIAWHDSSWEVIFEGPVGWYPDNNNDYPYCWIQDLADIEISLGSTWRITYDDTTYILTGVPEGNTGYVCIGNSKWGGVEDNNIDAPFVFTNYGWGAWTGNLNISNEEQATLYFKIERLSTS